jgi:diaminopimelate dehydrogenase
MTIKIGILGYGNLGRGAEAAISQNDDMELVGVFTRRDPASLTLATPGVAVRSAQDLLSGAPLDIDVLVICGGSATDLPQMTPKYAARYNVIDSFDTHAHIPEHFAAVDKVAGENGHVALISSGWDPGLFSLNRLFGNCFVPQGTDYTFWGPGVSQGHSDAVRRIDGVLDARQYTLPVEEALEEVRSGSNPDLTTRQKHTREVFVVAAEGADTEEITRQIVTMPNYFDEYDTTVHFISQEEMDRDHSGLPHGGFVLRSGAMASGATSVIEYSLKLDSNPDFTSSVMLAYARAVARMSSEGQKGCRTVFDVAPAYLSSRDDGYLRSHFL